MTILTCNRCGRRRAVDEGTIDTHPNPDGGVCGGVFSLLPEDNPDYVTLLTTVKPHKNIVAVMVFNKADDGYTIKKCSQSLGTRNAAALAESWAQALKLEIR